MRDSAAGVLEGAEIVVGNAILAADLDRAELLLADPVPNGDNLYTVAGGDVRAGVQFCHSEPPLFVYFDSCVYLGFVILWFCEIQYEEKPNYLSKPNYAHILARFS
nr:MAG TPA: hypothetical protein [Caudoviricetes sp.]